MGIKRTGMVLAATATVVLGSATMAQAGKVVATISFDTSTSRMATPPSFGAQVGFRVDANVSKASDLYLLWVANKCYQGGSLASVEYKPIQQSLAGTFTLGPAPMDGGPQGNWSSGGADCTSYVFVWPNTSTPVRGASMTYQVAP